MLERTDKFLALQMARYALCSAGDSYIIAPT